MVRFLHGTNQTDTTSRNSSSVAVPQRERKNGWSCPWHPLQLIAWFFLAFFAISYFGIFVFYLPVEWRPAGLIIPGGIYLFHFLVHILALSIDPADPNIRQGGNQKGIFDRNIHAHVIENDHCRICQTDIFPKSKHCSTCNKCVSDFDHHCKWLNTCVGGRNYKLFVACISSAFVGALTMSVVTLYLFVSFFTARNVILKSQNNGQFNLFVSVSETAFIIFIGINQALYLLAIGLLGHLLGFHIYLMYLNISTYEYIVNARDSKTSNTEAACERGTPHPFRNNKVQPLPESMENGELSSGANNHTNSRPSVQEQSESTVKVMNEISSKVAKRNSTNALYTNQQTSLDESGHHETIPQENASSESPRENTQYTPPTVTVHSRSGRFDNGKQTSTDKGCKPNLSDNESSNGSELELQRNDMNNQETLVARSRKDENSSRQANDIVQNGHSSPSGRQSGSPGLTKSKEESSDSEGEELIPLAVVPPITSGEDNQPKKKRKKKRKADARDLPPLRPLPTLGQYSESPC